MSTIKEARWMTGHLASAVEITPVPVEPFWRVQIEYDWIEPGDSGSGRAAMPSFGSLDAARESLARLQANPLEALNSQLHPSRVYTVTRWRILRFEVWSLIFDEELP